MCCHVFAATIKFQFRPSEGKSLGTAGLKYQNHTIKDFQPFGLNCQHVRKVCLFNISSECLPVVQHMLDFGESGWFWLFYGSQKSRSTLRSGHFSNFIHSFNITSRWKPCRIDSGSLSNSDPSVKCVQSRPCQTSQKTNTVINVFFEIDKEQDWEAAGLNHDHTSARAKQTQHWWCSARYCTQLLEFRWREDPVLMPQRGPTDLFRWVS